MKKLKFDVSSWEKVQKKPGEFGRIFLGISVGLLKRSSKDRPDSLELNRIRNQLTMYQTVNSTVESIYIYSAASDLILSSGSLLLASELEEFPDEGIQRLLEHTEELEANSLILRKTTGVYHIDQDEDQKVYTKILSAGRGSMVVVNLDYDEIVQGILSTDILNESRMLIVNGGEESLVDVQTAPIDLTEELLDAPYDRQERGLGPPSPEAFVEKGGTWNETGGSEPVKGRILKRFSSREQAFYEKSDQGKDGKVSFHCFRGEKIFCFDPETGKAEAIQGTVR